MVLHRRKFERPMGERRYKKLFLIATEGNKTEPIYFSIFDDGTSIVRVSCLKNKHKSAPTRVLKLMTDYLESEGIKPSDEAWLVVDKDGWTDEQLMQIHQWSLQQENHNFALSNPNFEYWLLLHFEEGKGIRSSRDCTDRLKQLFPDYDKRFDNRKITGKQIERAILRAKQRDNVSCKDWPRNLGQTTVYKLIESILKSRKELVPK